MNDLKYAMKIRAGLGEEVLADEKKEGRIEKAAKMIEEDIQAGLGYEDIARRVAKIFSGSK